MKRLQNCCEDQRGSGKHPPPSQGVLANGFALKCAVLNLANDCCRLTPSGLGNKEVMPQVE